MADGVLDEIGKELRQQLAVTTHVQARHDPPLQILPLLLGDRLVRLDQPVQQLAECDRM